MTGKTRDASERAGKSKQTEPAEVMPRDVGEFVGTVAYEVQSISWLARGLCEADASQESASLRKRRSRPLDEGVDSASKSLLHRPLSEILEKKNVHVAEDEAVSSMGNLATVIESRLNILHEFAQAVQKRNILGTPEGLQYLDKHRTAHFPRIVPLVEPRAEHSQLVEKIAKLKRENAIIQEENDELAHDLGQRDADPEFDASSSSGQSRRHLSKVRSGAFIERMSLILAGLIFGALFTGFGWWIAHLQSQRAAFEAGRAEQAIELRHIAEVNAAESGRIAAEAKTLASEKDAWQERAKAVIRKHLERAKAARDEDSPIDSLISLRIAGDILAQSHFDDSQLDALHDGSRKSIVLELVGYLYPNEAAADVLLRIAKERKKDVTTGRSDQRPGGSTGRG